MKAPGHYVQRSNGLFPAPIPQDNKNINKICKLFELLGLFLAKCIQDGRRVDIPLSDSFLKLMCSQPQNSSSIATLPGLQRNSSLDGNELTDRAHHERRGVERLLSEDNDSPNRSNQNNTRRGIASNTEGLGGDTLGGASNSIKEKLILVDVDEKGTKKDSSKEDEISMPSQSTRDNSKWFSGVLSTEDLYEIDPHRKVFLKELSDMMKKRDAIIATADNTTPQEKQEKMSSLTLGKDSDRLEDIM